MCIFLQALTDDLWRDMVRLGRVRGRPRRDAYDGTVYHPYPATSITFVSGDGPVPPAVQVAAAPTHDIVGAPGGGFAGNPPGAPPGSCSKSMSHVCVGT
jgi:hypothetical protein